jgi:putative spermidine/putrescine transport system ATP-binding protein
MSAKGTVPSAVRLDRVSVAFPDVVAVNDVSLDLPAGEMLALLGPSGCGKTTLLRSVAGFVPHAGEVHIGEDCVTHVQPHRRNIGMVFQDYALFPHMTVAQNVAFGLRMRGFDRKAIEAQVSEALTLVGLEGLHRRMAPQLSGGQQQRVALARALVIRPAVLLLDEPLSALDKKLREEMRSELKRIQRIAGVTTIFVTHDQDEALALADRLALMYAGTVLQSGVPEDVYRHPASHFVAEFLGAANSKAAVCRQRGAQSILLEIPGIGFVKAAGRAATLSAGQKVTMYIRPERIKISPGRSEHEIGGLPATLTRRTYLGRHVEFSVRFGDGTLWTAHIGDEAALSRLDMGSDVVVEVDPNHVIVFADA